MRTWGKAARLGGVAGLVVSSSVLAACGPAVSGAEGSSAPPPASSSPAADGGVVVLADRSTSGTACGGRGEAAWSAVLSRGVGGSGRGVVTAGDEGAGYVARGSNGSTLTDLVLAEVDEKARVVVVVGGAGDAASLFGVDPAADAVVKLVRSSAPRATVVLVGPMSPTGAGDESLSRVDAALRQVAVRNGVRHMSALEWGSGTPARFCAAGQLTDHGERELGEHLADTVGLLVKGSKNAR